MEHAVLQKKLGLLRCTLMPVEVTLGVVKVWSGFCRGCQGISGVKRWVTVGPYRIGAGRVRGDQVQSINGMRFQAAAPSHDPSADALSNVAVFEPLHGWDVEICGYICWYMLYIHMYIYIYIYYRTIILVGGWATHLNNMKITGDYYSQRKNHTCSKPPTRRTLLLPW